MILCKGQKSTSQIKKITKGYKESQNTILLKELKNTKSKKIRKNMILKKEERNIKNFGKREIRPKEKNLEQLLTSPWIMPVVNCMPFFAKE